jgi:hypothetical protein
MFHEANELTGWIEVEDVEMSTRGHAGRGRIRLTPRQDWPEGDRSRGGRASDDS